MKKSLKAGNKFHTPVLLQEAVNWLKVKPNCWYVDATVGGGGHAAEILRRGGRVLGIDQDSQALKAAKEHLSYVCPDASWQLIKGNFARLEELVRRAQIDPVAGVLFDLGVSSWQLTGHGRGFSFQKDEPLDMRMDPQVQQVTAKDLLAALSERELYEIFKNLAQEQLARPIASRLVRARRQEPIVSTGQLRKLVGQVYVRLGRKRGKLDPATKVFQALRMVVNSELDNLKEGLSQAVEVVEVKGRIVVISFHEGEDRLVKRQFLAWQSQGLGEVLTPKPITPKEEEIKINQRSRSAKLRAFKKS